MFKLTIGSAIDRKIIDFDLDCTPRQALEENDLDYSTGAIHLDGATIKGADLDKSFKELGVTTKASLIVVVKADAAM